MRSAEMGIGVFRAVIFDLFGTLVNAVSPGEYARVVRALAGRLGVDAEIFSREWNQPGESRLRVTCMESQAEAIRRVCENAGWDVRNDAISAAVTEKVDAHRLWLEPWAESLEALDRLRNRGMRLGLMSVCSCEAAALWQTTKLARMVDVAMFSCEVGMVKPEAAFYLKTAVALDVKPAECLYVGDTVAELVGAQAVGMRGILIVGRNSATNEWDEHGWEGKIVKSPLEVAAELDKPG
jgi:putative hydrolase of the HAD superfamily